MARRKIINNILPKESRQPFRQNLSVGTVQYEFLQFEEAVVVDVIVNDIHPSYSADGTNVGNITFRFINSQQYLPNESLNEAAPHQPNISDYPLLNEIVYVFRALNRWYYFSKFNVSNQVTTQPIFGLNNQLSPIKDNLTTTQQKTNIANGGSEIKTGGPDQETKLGESFVNKDGIFRLRHQEGDIIIEGRSGHSIRFGSDIERNQAPNILFRVGPDEKIDDTRVVPLVDEDINVDLSSIWMVANQTIPLTFSTIEEESHFKSMESPLNELSGNQIVINTDRLVINTKQKELLVSTFLGTHFTTLQNHTVDTEKDYKSFNGRDRQIEIHQDCRISVGRDYLLSIGNDHRTSVEGNSHFSAEKDFSITSGRIFIGSVDDNGQPLVLGEQLRQFINELLTIFVQNSAIFTLPTVGLGPLNPTVVAEIQQLQIKYGINTDGQDTPGFLSKNNFVTR